MHWVEANRFLKGGVMLNLKLNKFLGLLQEILVELKMIRKLLEGENAYIVTVAGTCEDDE